MTPFADWYTRINEAWKANEAQTSQRGCGLDEAEQCKSPNSSVVVGTKPLIFDQAWKEREMSQPRGVCVRCGVFEGSWKNGLCRACFEPFPISKEGVSDGTQGSDLEGTGRRADTGFLVGAADSGLHSVVVMGPICKRDEDAIDWHEIADMKITDLLAPNYETVKKILPHKYSDDPQPIIVKE